MFHTAIPMRTCRVVSECRSVVHQLEWCQDSTRLLALDQNNVIHIWRMKVTEQFIDCASVGRPVYKQQQNINTWVCAQKQEPDPSSDATVVHAAWLEYKPKVGTKIITTTHQMRCSLPFSPPSILSPPPPPPPSLCVCVCLCRSASTTASRHGQRYWNSNTLVLSSKC